MRNETELLVGVPPNDVETMPFNVLVTLNTERDKVLWGVQPVGRSLYKMVHLKPLASATTTAGPAITREDAMS